MNLRALINRWYSGGVEYPGGSLTEYTVSMPPLAFAVLSYFLFEESNVAEGWMGVALQVLAILSALLSITSLVYGVRLWAAKLKGHPTKKEKRFLSKEYHDG
ncbi:hypothetical protein [Sphingomicrobium lutaoense]|uniref:Uncharacterized protein n=1 Tax=Sphingomicrobium lutaoense TaxID=515949 RepID=A0A839YZJ5_9SPHN|nr:hypothetical protein [Sphingomicrobium lutaoense]MBB3763880.1 hypothetical protein [Sphingomicrobium lutaoense]